MKTTALRQKAILVTTLCFTVIASVIAANEPQVVRFTDVVPAMGGRNLVPNGSFELGSAGWSSLGTGTGQGNSWAPLVDWGNFDRLQGEIETGGIQGNRFLRIRLGGRHTPVFNFDYFDPVHRRELSPLAASMGWIEVTPGQPYTLSLHMRASRNDTRAAFGILSEDANAGLGADRKPILHKVRLTQRWKRYSHTFTPKHPFLFVLAGPDLERERNVAVDVDAIQLEKGSQASGYEARSPVEISVVPVAPAGVFVASRAKLKLTANNSSQDTVTAQVRFNVTDYADQLVEIPNVKFQIPPNSKVERTVALPAHWRGFYRINPEWSVGADARQDRFSSRTGECRLLRIAIVPRLPKGDTILGVNHAYPTASLIELAEKAGISWYRDWSLKWQHVEPERGKYRWSVSDPQIERIHKGGHQLVAMFPFPSTDWNSSGPDVKTLVAESPYYATNGKGDAAELLVRARWAWAPRDVNELTRFLTTAVSRYQKQINVWEFLNEPLYTAYSLPDNWVLKSKTIKGHTVHDYIDLLRAAAPAIRAGNPRAKIIGGPAVHPESDYNALMFKAGLLEHVDIYGVHDYPGKTKPEARLVALNKLVREMKAHGGVKPMWMTEFSYFGTDDPPRKPFVPIEGLWSETRLLSEKETADYTVRYCTMFLGCGGQKIFLHSGCTGSVNHPGTESCLFADGAVRKVFPAMAVFAETMGRSPQYVGNRTNGSAFFYAFEMTKRSILVLWDPEEKTSVSIPAGVTCKDIVGRRVSGASIRLTGSPVYFVAPAKQAANLLSSLE